MSYKAARAKQRQECGGKCRDLLYRGNDWQREKADMEERRKVCARDQVEGKQSQEHWRWIQTVCEQCCGAEERVSGKIMSLKQEIKDVILNVVSIYAPQARSQLEKTEKLCWIK